jgi:MoaA/NifB/PqqE/SkfB family radical SAM enzyme
MESVIHATSDSFADRNKLDFIWLELTNRCNLQCLHCYSESNPTSTARDLLNESQYSNVILEAHELGCRQLQFIGGEPTLNKGLPRLIAYAHQLGYEFIEVFSNLTNLSDALLSVFLRYRVAIATSVYASMPELHDKITLSAGSHRRTISNIQRLVAGGLQVRVGVIAMEQNRDAIDATFEFLRGLGVTNIGLDHVRGFGRAQRQASCSMEDLCGNCAGNILAIGPDGRVAPCIMSRAWSVGSVLDAPLGTIARSDSLFGMRRQIAAATATGSLAAQCYPECAPHNPICGPNCSPNSECTPCFPKGGTGCNPNRWCDPTKG